MAAVSGKTQLRQRNRHGRTQSGSGSSTSAWRRSDSSSGSQSSEMVPSAALLPDSEQPAKVWTNQHGRTLPEREVVGHKVLIRQQPAAPPRQPQVLILTDQMLERFPQPDKYFKLLSMFGYSIQDYTVDVRDELIDLTYEYVIVFLGTMQLGLFDSLKNYEAVSALVTAINRITPNSHVLVTGLVPRPMDYPHSRKRCENVNNSYCLIVQELHRKHAFNVGYLDVFLEFIELDGCITEPRHLFVEDIFLSEAGAHKLRAIWLHHLGFFPKKAVELMSVPQRL